MNEGSEVSIRQIVGNRDLYVTRWWGFRPDRWAGVMFGDEGIRDEWTLRCPDGGFVLGFASHNFQEQIDPADRGRVFGIYQFIPEKVAYTDAEIIDPAYLSDPSLRNRGEFRWPYGMRAIRGWKFVNPKVMTRESLPDARRMGFILTRSMAPITGRDLELVDQYPLVEVGIYKRPFEPLRLVEPNAVPDGNYLLVCQDEEILCRMPGWRKDEILFKPGIASDFDSRADSLNNHAIARMFGLKLESVWKKPAPSTEVAREREEKMLAVGEQLCRLAAKDQREFFLGPKSAMMAFIGAAGGITRVA
ncbi:MAG TPA: hypothetical protein PKE16_08755 [Hyphomicrobium sp.]|nr:hypothetical protein [Hyphomicrobium sp.]